MKSNLLTFTLVIFSCTACLFSAIAADFTPGVQHNYTHESGNVPRDTYQYSVWVPKDYDAKRAYPVVFYLHGGGRGRTHPDQGKRNMISTRLVDNQRWTDAGYSSNARGQSGYIHVAPVKPVARWNARQFKRLLDHVTSKVNVDKDRVYVTGFSMGGQGTWHVGCGSSLGYKIAAMMPLGAWGCNEVKRGTTPGTCMTRKTPVWVLHCPLDNVSRISEQIPLFDNHLACGGYGRFTMIPGKGHISRPRGDDNAAFSMRMAWMLSQTYNTPFNYLLQINDAIIMEVVSGERAFLGDTAHYGFFEPGSVVRLTAPETKDGKRFVKWAGPAGSRFANATSRRTTYTTGTGDAQLTPVYATDSVKLTVVQGKATPANPKPGDIVTITANADTSTSRFFFWEIDQQIDIPNPYARSVRFCMPSHNVTINARLHPRK